METVRIPVKILRTGAAIPSYQTSNAAGMDLCAAPGEDIILEGGRWARIPTGIAVAIPPGWEGQIRPRSGLADAHGITILNAPGTIDPDYRGEVQLLVINVSQQPFRIREGMRLAQMVVTRTSRAQLIVTEEMEDTSRGSGGFGHTGY
ncbi:MAG: dUTP diphosphatase [Deltaproteobacteria bacterium]|nr:dUTP diphosphatase [Deltaproteobacteria bacterium]MBW2308696.1 dUTP diphosphatase [Deltaproteobacteria bacterium]